MNGQIYIFLIRIVSDRRSAAGNAAVCVCVASSHNHIVPGFAVLSSITKHPLRPQYNSIPRNSVAGDVRPFVRTRSRVSVRVSPKLILRVLRDTFILFAQQTHTHSHTMVYRQNNKSSVCPDNDKQTGYVLHFLQPHRGCVCVRTDLRGVVIFIFCVMETNNKYFYSGTQSGII